MPQRISCLHSRFSLREKLSFAERKTTILAVIVCGLCLSGCGDGRPSRVPISGKVLIDGQPLTQGHVRFVPADARPSLGTLDAQGAFRLTCFDGQDGAVPGSHRVEVIAAEELSSTEMQWHAPKKYSDFETSGLVVHVDKPRDDLVLELSWDGGKPYVEKFGQ